MPVIKAGTRKDGNVKGADYGASTSLILDERDPGQGPRLASCCNAEATRRIRPSPPRGALRYELFF